MESSAGNSTQDPPPALITACCFTIVQGHRARRGPPQGTPRAFSNSSLGVNRLPTYSHVDDLSACDESIRMGGHWSCRACARTRAFSHLTSPSTLFPNGLPPDDPRSRPHQTMAPSLTWKQAGTTQPLYATGICLRLTLSPLFPTPLILQGSTRPLPNAACAS